MVVKGYARIEYAGQALCPRKNVEGTLAAYARVRRAEPNAPPMVILGAGVKGRLTPAVLQERFGLEHESRRLRRPHRPRGHARGVQRRQGAAVSILLRELRNPAGGGDGLWLPGHYLERARVSRGRGRRGVGGRSRRRGWTCRSHAPRGQRPRLWSKTFACAAWRARGNSPGTKAPVGFSPSSSWPAAGRGATGGPGESEAAKNCRRRRRSRSRPAATGGGRARTSAAAFKCWRGPVSALVHRTLTPGCSTRT